MARVLPADIQKMDHTQSPATTPVQDRPLNSISSSEEASVNYTNSSSEIMHDATEAEMKHASSIPQLSESITPPNSISSSEQTSVNYTNSSSEIMHDATEAEIKHASSIPQLSESITPPNSISSSEQTSVNYTNSSSEIRHGATEVEIKHASSIPEVSESIAASQNSVSDSVSSLQNSVTSLHKSVSDSVTSVGDHEFSVTCRSVPVNATKIIIIKNSDSQNVDPDETSYSGKEFHIEVISKDKPTTKRRIRNNMKPKRGVCYEDEAGNFKLQLSKELLSMNNGANQTVLNIPKVKKCSVVLKRLDPELVQRLNEKYKTVKQKQTRFRRTETCARARIHDFANKDRTTHASAEIATPIPDASKAETVASDDPEEINVGSYQQNAFSASQNSRPSTSNVDEIIRPWETGNKTVVTSQHPVPSRPWLIDKGQNYNAFCLRPKPGPKSQQSRCTSANQHQMPYRASDSLIAYESFWHCPVVSMKNTFGSLPRNIFQCNSGYNQLGSSTQSLQQGSIWNNQSHSHLTPNVANTHQMNNVSRGLPPVFMNNINSMMDSFKIPSMYPLFYGALLGSMNPQTTQLSQPNSAGFGHQNPCHNSQPASQFSPSINKGNVSQSSISPQLPSVIQSPHQVSVPAIVSNDQNCDKTMPNAKENRPYIDIDLDTVKTKIETSPEIDDELLNDIKKLVNKTTNEPSETKDGEKVSLSTSTMFTALMKLKARAKQQQQEKSTPAPVAESGSIVQQVETPATGQQVAVATHDRQEVTTLDVHKSTTPCVSESTSPLQTHPSNAAVPSTNLHQAEPPYFGPEMSDTGSTEKQSAVLSEWIDMIPSIDDPSNQSNVNPDENLTNLPRPSCMFVSEMSCDDQATSNNATQNTSSEIIVHDEDANDNGGLSEAVISTRISNAAADSSGDETDAYEIADYLSTSDRTTVDALQREAKRKKSKKRKIAEQNSSDEDDCKKREHVIHRKKRRKNNVQYRENFSDSHSASDQHKGYSADEHGCKNGSLSADRRKGKSRPKNGYKLSVANSEADISRRNLCITSISSMKEKLIFKTGNGIPKLKDLTVTLKKLDTEILEKYIGTTQATRICSRGTNANVYERNNNHKSGKKRPLRAYKGKRRRFSEKNNCDKEIIFNESLPLKKKQQSSVKSVQQNGRDFSENNTELAQCKNCKIFQKSKIEETVDENNHINLDIDKCIVENQTIANTSICSENILNSNVPLEYAFYADQRSFADMLKQKNVKMFVCDVCGCAFAREDRYKEHLQFARNSLKNETQENIIQHAQAVFHYIHDSDSEKSVTSPLVALNVQNSNMFSETNEPSNFISPGRRCNEICDNETYSVIKNLNGIPKNSEQVQEFDQPQVFSSTFEALQDFCNESLQQLSELESKNSDSDTMDISNIDLSNTSINCLDMLMENKEADKEDEQLLQMDNDLPSQLNQPTLNDSHSSLAIDLAKQCIAITCKWCMQKYSSVKQAVEHFGRVHLRNSPYVYCEPCGVVLMSKYNYEQHIGTYHKDVPEQACQTIPCSCCERYFTNNEEHEEHLCKDHQNPFQCVTCHQTFTTTLKLTEHNWSVHKVVSDSPCPVCGIPIPCYLGTHILQNHSEFVPLDINYNKDTLAECSLCGAKIGSDSEHSCEEIKKGNCMDKEIIQDCIPYNEKYTSFFLQFIHVVYYHIMLKYDRHKVLSHAARWLPEKSLMYKISNSKRQDFKVHRRKFLEKKVKVICTICNKSLSQNALEKHMCEMHNMFICQSWRWEMSKHACQKCDRKFPTRHDLLKHIYRNHKAKKTIEMHTVKIKKLYFSYCFYKAKKKMNFKFVANSKIIGMPRECSDCKKRFFNRNVMFFHKRRHKRNGMNINLKDKTRCDQTYNVKHGENGQKENLMNIV